MFHTNKLPKQWLSWAHSIHTNNNAQWHYSCGTDSRQRAKPKSLIGHLSHCWSIACRKNWQCGKWEWQWFFGRLLSVFRLLSRISCQRQQSTLGRRQTNDGSTSRTTKWGHLRTERMFAPTIAPVYDSRRIGCCTTSEWRAASIRLPAAFIGAVRHWPATAQRIPSLVATAASFGQTSIDQSGAATAEWVLRHRRQSAVSVFSDWARLKRGES